MSAARRGIRNDWGRSATSAGDSIEANRKVALRHRQRAYKQVRSFIKGQRYGALSEKITRWLNTKGWRQGLSKGEKNDLTREITLFTNQVLDDHLCKVLIAGRNIQRMDDEALHRLRIECKKLRYATEFFSPLYGQEMAVLRKYYPTAQLRWFKDAV